MCFIDEAEWTADVHEETTCIAQERHHCDECGAAILPGEWCQKVEQREHECCQECDEDGEWYDEEDPQDPATCDHDYGETYSGVTCVACLKILAGIYAVEEDEGCPDYARQPLRGALREEMREHGSAPEYAERALQMFPELAGNRMIEHATQVG